VAQLVDLHLKQGMAPVEAAGAALRRLEGAYALAMVFAGHPELMVGACHGAPLAVGFGEEEMFLGSDALALAPLTRRIAFLGNGDWTVLSRTGAVFLDATGAQVTREVKLTALSGAAVGKGNYRHFMEKELHEHPGVIGDTLHQMVDPASRAVNLPKLPFDPAKLSRVSLSACGGAYFAAMAGRHWLEEIARLPADVDVASEFRYREPPMIPGSLGVLVSQSGETADTIAAMDYMRSQGMPVLSVVNVPESTMARASDVVMQTVAGPEIAVASTKAFTTQLTVLACLAIAFARARGTIDQAREAALTQALLTVPAAAAEVLDQAAAIQRVARRVAEARDVLYLGRGANYAIALEGALKLKEICYIHAEGYAAGEMKHGPIALIDKAVPIIAIAPSGPLFEKTASNVQEAAARGGQVIVLSDAEGAAKLRSISVDTIVMPKVDPFVAPILYAIPVQLLAYHVAVLKGTDVDQPRNLAKSVTVE
jgi:glucosamine--fructose-6-phosphate aminotransferase (isomerizing)